jgi:hypothetical protein
MRGTTVLADRRSAMTMASSPQTVDASGLSLHPTLFLFLFLSPRSPRPSFPLVVARRLNPTSVKSDRAMERHTGVAERLAAAGDDRAALLAVVDREPEPSGEEAEAALLALVFSQGEAVAHVTCERAVYFHDVCCYTREKSIVLASSSDLARFWQRRSRLPVGDPRLVLCTRPEGPFRSLVREEAQRLQRAGSSAADAVEEALGRVLQTRDPRPSPSDAVFGGDGSVGEEGSPSFIPFSGEGRRIG